MLRLRLPRCLSLACALAVACAVACACATGVLGSALPTLGVLTTYRIPGCQSRYDHGSTMYMGSGECIVWGLEPTTYVRQVITSANTFTLSYWNTTTESVACNRQPDVTIAGRSDQCNIPYGMLDEFKSYSMDIRTAQTVAVPASAITITHPTHEHAVSAPIASVALPLAVHQLPERAESASASTSSLGALPTLSVLTTYRIPGCQSRYDPGSTLYMNSGECIVWGLEPTTYVRQVITSPNTFTLSYWNTSTEAVACKQQPDVIIYGSTDQCNLSGDMQDEFKSYSMEFRTQQTTAVSAPATAIIHSASPRAHESEHHAATSKKPIASESPLIRVKARKHK